MAHFYGILRGSHGPATRCGTAESGLVTQAAGWSGCIQVGLTNANGLDEYEVWLTPWKNSGGKPRLIARGLLTAINNEDNEED